jgi:hypothetical protein
VTPNRSGQAACWWTLSMNRCQILSIFIANDGRFMSLMGLGAGKTSIARGPDFHGPDGLVEPLRSRLQAECLLAEQKCQPGPVGATR